ncbi:MAG: LysR family transcriptional regulator [Pseudomonas sp.]|nr:LysR family transcriptional regulator [Pseudomonas sp.]
MLDLNDIAIFVQIVDAGSFVGAARRIGVPSNTLSRRIKQLEENLEVRLLHRSTRKLVLTEAGQSLYERSAAQISQLIEVSREFVGGSQVPAGRVRVAAPADFFEIFLMSWIEDFLARYPKVHLDFVLSDERSDLIAEGIDVAFRAGVLPDSSLVARRISTGRQMLAASPAYLQAHGAPVDIDALADHACIRSSDASGQKAWQLVGPHGPVQISVSGRFSANTAQAQLKAAAAGLGICLLPEAILRGSLKAGLLVEVLAGYGRPNNDFSLVYPSRRQIPAAVTAFVEHAVVHLQTDIFDQ